MNPEIKAKWVAALRSGKYKQGQGCLRDSDNNFCCLGVLCDVINPALWSLTPIPDSRPCRSRLAFTHDGFSDMPSGTHIRDLFPWQREALIDMNDNNGTSFSKIADFIEKDL